MKENNKKKLKGAATLTLAAALLVSGSLAWQDVSQHKTNNFATKSVAHSMVLVEDFDPIEGWTLGQEIKKEVSVRNGQESDDTTRFAYNDGYVRLQIREFMGIAEQTYVTHPERLMIQTSGDFYRFETESEADAEVANLKLPNATTRVVEVQGINDDKPYFYIKTEAGDANGQYGKFLITDITTGDIKSIVDGAVVADLDKDVTDKHNSTDGNNQEDGAVYSTHLWAEGQDNYTPTANKFTEYVKWTLGADVITLQQWKDNYHSKPVAKWIVDTSDTTNGYVYWGQRLDHATKASATSLTSKLLEKVTLIKQPQGHAEYRIHVNMDAVSYDDLGKWTDGNSDIMDAYKNNVEMADLLAELQETIARGEATDVSGMSADTVQALNDAIQAGKDVLTAGGPTTHYVKDAIKDINDAIGGLKVSYKVKLEELLPIASSDEHYVEKYYVMVSKWDNLESAISNANLTLSNSSSTENQYEVAYNSLSIAFENFKDGKGIGKVGDQIYMSNRKFTILKEAVNEQYSMIISDTITKDEMIDLGFTSIIDSNGYIKLYASANQANASLSKPYDQTDVKKVTDKFYDSYILGSPHESKVLPISYQLENPVYDGTDNPIGPWSVRADNPTIVDLNGSKEAFALSISDYNSNIYGTTINKNDLISGDGNKVRYWMRTPGHKEHYYSYMFTAGTVASYPVWSSFAVRPLMWVEMPSTATQP